MSSGDNSDVATKVVVVGGQFGGRRAARLLQSGGFDVTLVDAKGFWEYTPGALRCLVEPKAARRMVIPQPQGTVTAAAVGLQASANGKVTGVELSNGQSIDAEYVVLATVGSLYPLVRKTDECFATHTLLTSSR